MSEGSDSFNATGPTLVAFETTSADVPVLQQFGVSVVGTNCGVYGQGTDGDQKDRHRAPVATGVFGRGDTHGVYGISGSVDDDNTPDFTDQPILDEAIGVVGVSGSEEGGAPAVFGDNDILRKDLASFPNVHRNVQLEAARLPVGVEGVSWSGFGVYGISLNLNVDHTADLSVDPQIRGTAFDAIHDAIDPWTDNYSSPAGVLGLSVQGAGVRGVSALDRGGIFQSATFRNDDATRAAVAQIRLVPHRVSQIDAKTRNPQLPRDGQTGDLLAVVSPDPIRRDPFQRSTLWFCERGRHLNDSAVWRKVALTDTVIGT